MGVVSERDGERKGGQGTEEEIKQLGEVRGENPFVNCVLLPLKYGDRSSISEAVAQRAWRRTFHGQIEKFLNCRFGNVNPNPTQRSESWQFLVFESKRPQKVARSPMLTTVRTAG